MDNLAVDDVFSSFTDDRSQGDGSVIFRPVFVTLFEDGYDVSFFPFKWDFSLIEGGVEENAKNRSQFICSFFEEIGRQVIRTTG